MSTVVISRDFVPGRDEGRLLIVGAQVLVDFQSRAAFEPGFEGLSCGAGHRATPSPRVSQTARSTLPHHKRGCRDER
jgi:hypothetical protein